MNEVVFAAIAIGLGFLVLLLIDREADRDAAASKKRSQDFVDAICRQMDQNNEEELRKKWSA